MYFEFNRYQLFFYAKPFQHRFVQLYQDETLVGTITFDDFDAVPENTAAPNRINLKMHSQDYPQVVDLLRNEAPLFIWMNPDNGIGGLSTNAEEPVGEGE